MLPDCARLLGPIVPGATLQGGARVPGTSYELDPPQAAFNLTLLLCWGESETPPAPEDHLGVVLAIADWRARRALMEGRPPETVGALLTQLMLAEDLERALRAAVPERASRLAATSELLVTGMLGGNGARGQALLARAPSPIFPGVYPPSPSPSPLPLPSPAARAVQRAEAAAQGVLRALRILAIEGAATGQRAAADPAEVAYLEAAPEPEPEPDAARLAASDPSRDDEGFAAAVKSRFPSKRASALLARCADRSQLEATPVSAFVALLVTN